MKKPKARPEFKAWEAMILCEIDANKASIESLGKKIVTRRAYLRSQIKMLRTGRAQEKRYNTARAKSKE